MLTFHPSAQTSKSLGLEFLREALFSCTLSIFLNLVIWMDQISGVYSINQDATSDISLIQPPELLIVHLVGFAQVGASDFIENIMAFHCDQSISLTKSKNETKAIRWFI